MADQEQLSLTEAAERLDVHYMTAYRYVRTGRLPAVKRGGQWWVNPDEIDQFKAPRRQTNVDDPTHIERAIPLLRRRAIAGDENGSWALVVEALAYGASPADIHLKLISPMLEGIGEDWEAGRLSIAEEHRCSVIAGRIIGRLTPLFRHAGPRPCRVVLGSVQGEMHAMTTAILADLLVNLSFDVIDLGANTPAEAFVDTAASFDDLAAVGLCATTSSAEEPLRASIAHIRSELPDLRLFVGGRLGASLGPTLGVDGWADAGDEALALFVDARQKHHELTATDIPS